MKAVVSKYTVRVVYHFKAKGQGKKQTGNSKNEGTKNIT